MPLITERNEVVDIYADAAERKWVIPSFCAENLTTTEAILAGAQAYAEKTGKEDVPVTVAITNQYNHRSQSARYTRIGQWDVGLQLFLADLRVLCGPASPFRKLKVIVHLDHTQWDNDAELLQWDMRGFSMIMYDASELPFDENIRQTAQFVAEHGDEIVIEGACDAIVDAAGEEQSRLTDPDMAERYLGETGVDYIVANLGTEHRASAADLKYHADLARRIRARIGPKLVLHGTSSVGRDQVRNLFDDGVAKVNIWTCLERDSTPALFADMAVNAAKVAGPAEAQRLQKEGILGPNAEVTSPASLAHYTTTYRQDIIFERMKQIVGEYLELWYV